MNRETIRRKLKTFEGETFYTSRGLPFTYRFIDENRIVVDRTYYPLDLSNFEKAIEIGPRKTSDISVVRGPSYVFGIITDSRFKREM